MNMEWDFLCGYCISSQASWILNILQSTADITLYNVCSVHRGNTMSTLGGYHECIREDIMSTSPHASYPPDVLNIPPCTHDILVMYLWYPLMYSWYHPDTLNTPRCTHGILPMLLNTHYTGWIFLMGTHTIEKCSTSEEDHQYLWGISTVAMRIFSTCVENHQYPWVKLHSFFIQKE